jgi:hypothetical protein
MKGWKWIGGGFAVLWSLFWIGWTADIYLADDVFVFPFVELALGIPLLGGLIAALIAKILRPLRAKTKHPNGQNTG